MIGALTGRGRQTSLHPLFGDWGALHGQGGYGVGFSCCVEADIGVTASTAFWNGVPGMGKEGCGRGIHFGWRKT